MSLSTNCSVCGDSILVKNAKYEDDEVFCEECWNRRNSEVKEN